MTLNLENDLKQSGRTKRTCVYKDLHVHQVPHTSIMKDQDALHDDHIRCIYLLSTKTWIVSVRYHSTQHSETMKLRHARLPFETCHYIVDVSYSRKQVSAPADSLSSFAGIPTAVPYQRRLHQTHVGLSKCTTNNRPLILSHQLQLNERGSSLQAHQDDRSCIRPHWPTPQVTIRGRKNPVPKLGEMKFLSHIGNVSIQ